MLATLRTYWRQRPRRGPYRFPSPRPGQPLSRKAVWHLRRRAARRARRRTRVTPPTVRHRFATPRLEAGPSIRVIPVLLGYRSLRTTARSALVSPGHIGPVRSPLDTVPPAPPASPTMARPARAGCCAPASTPGLEVATIVRAHGAAVRQPQALSREQRQALRALAVCRTPALGGHLDVCARCGFDRAAYPSCLMGSDL